MPLRVTRRKSSGALTISGTVELADGTRRRIRRRAQSDDDQLAREQAAVIEATILRDAWHGERRGVRSFGEAVLSYLAADDRSESRKATLNRLVAMIGRLPLGSINQDTLTGLRGKVIRPDAKPATFSRQILGPVAAVMNHAAARGWCDKPTFRRPKEPAGRTRYLLPCEAERLVASAAPHLRPLLLFLIGTGARMSEALELEWRDVDLIGARAILWRTKNGRRRDVTLPLRVVAALAGLGHRDGPVFRWETKRSAKGRVKRVSAYADRDRRYGGQVKTAWRGAIKRAGINPALTPHDLRHTWASWHYALHRDLLALKEAGRWSSAALVERYAHLMKAGQEPEILAFLGHHLGTEIAAEAATA